MIRTLFALTTFAFAFLSLPSPAESTHSIGAGAHYWKVLDDIGDEDFDETGLSYIGMYRYDSGLLAIQAEMEVYPGDFGNVSEEVLSPQVVAILGDGLYAGIGAGILYSDGEFANKPFFLLRAGINILTIGPIVLDINANYIFTDFDELSSSDIDSDTITLGAMLRWDFN
ncbi:hypothetical protein P0Y35_15735 [Kiritimatiellaeota bacterium B1221]|nr:hypothetical protein [Kiritimatiellaeota bacterium B1221]